MPGQWLRDPRQFHQVNVEGTRNLAEHALAAAVSSFVYTSTIDVLAHQSGTPDDESTLAQNELPTPYERSKQLADQVVVHELDRGLPARFIHPPRSSVPQPTRTPGINAMPVLPPDLAQGQLAAATAPVGSRYILSDRYVHLTACRRPQQLPPLLPAGQLHFMTSHYRTTPPHHRAHNRLTMQGDAA